ncbi:exosome complex exonuclease RRP42-like [Pollicipes pollicipes]|uniref:exosome complex exonuclease RRP42-like n=1 Tax=Pollicipes pollicipes TaxID=41117 RepID=UPI001884B6B1|nr:exosome complex exonuclease RRP42-like [Pollicipes pollicipes]XP_037085197.1 exosome complex exonuclease RRP42-like [Pollicipes pollicipes]
MAEVLLSEAEKIFVIHGVQEDLRTDGRRRHDYRPLEAETGLVTHAAGSARVRLANTDVLVGVKAEIGAPDAARPDCGRLEFSVDCSANATPEFEGRGGEALAGSIASCLARAYSSPGVLDLRQLAIVPAQQCWILYVDILILECGGNLYDAVSCTVKAALFNARIPELEVSRADSGRVDVELSDDPFKVVRLSVENAPCLITLLLVDTECIVDPTQEEEACSKASLVTAVTATGSVTAVTKAGRGSLHPATVSHALKMASELGAVLNKTLTAQLEAEERIENRQIRGFLG